MYRISWSFFFFINLIRFLSHLIIYCIYCRCEDTINPLAIQESKYYHPSKDKWQKVKNRPTAWSLKPNSYIWLPLTEFFNENNHPGFPQEFALFVTLRLQNVSLFLFCYDLSHVNLYFDSLLKREHVRHFLISNNWYILRKFAKCLLKRYKRMWVKKKLDKGKAFFYLSFPFKLFISIFSVDATWYVLLKFYHSCYYRFFFLLFVGGIFEIILV